jgi:hypothetical protein
MNLSIIMLFSGYIYQITLHNIYRIDKMDLLYGIFWAAYPKLKS